MMHVLTYSLACVILSCPLSSAAPKASLLPAPKPGLHLPLPVLPAAQETPQTPRLQIQSPDLDDECESEYEPPTFPSPPINHGNSSGNSSAGAKGVGAWYATNDVQNMLDIGASWVYDWDAAPAFESELPSSIQFVPMISGPEKDVQSAWDSIKSGSGLTHILNFNEPDVNSISVQSAIDLYPKLQATGLRIGSPAPANAKLDGSDWFDSFMAQVKSQNLPLDFIALHHYADDFNVDSAVATFKSYIESVHDKYPYPIWITEYAMVNYDSSAAGSVPDDATQASYATASTQMLVSLGYVERFAWFALPYSSKQPACNLFNDASITQTGQAYKAV